MGLSTIERVLFLRGVELFRRVHTEELAPVARVAREVAFEGYCQVRFKVYRHAILRA